MNNNLNKNLPILYSRVPIEIQHGIPLDYLDSSNSSFKDYITCTICFGILVSPICCKNCKFKFCKDCIEIYFDVNQQNKCPYCSENFEASEIDSTTKDILYTTKLKCYFA